MYTLKTLINVTSICTALMFAVLIFADFVQISENRCHNFFTKSAFCKN